MGLFDDVLGDTTGGSSAATTTAGSGLFDDVLAKPAPAKATAGDYLKGVASGVNQLVSGIGYVAEKMGAEKAGKAIRGIGDRGAEYWTESMTPAGQKAAQTPVFQDDPNSALPSLSDDWGQAIGMGVAQSAPSMLGAALPGGIAAGAMRAGAGQLAARGIGGSATALAGGLASPTGTAMTNLAGHVAARAPAAVGMGAAEGATAGAMNAAGMKSRIEQMPEAELAKSPQYQELLQAGMQPAEARAQLAEQAAADVFNRTTLSTGGIGAITGGGALGSAYQKIVGANRDGLLKSIVKGAGEEALQETPQSGGERYIQNLAERDYLDPSVNPTQGVVADALSGGVIGGVMGGVVGGGGHVVSGRQPEQQPAPAPAAPPSGPLGKTVAAGEQSGAVPTLALPNMPNDPMVVFPDGSTGTRAQFDSYLASLPEEQRAAARAQMLGLGEQPVVRPEDAAQAAALAKEANAQAIARSAQLMQDETPAAEGIAAAPKKARLTPAQRAANQAAAEEDRQQAELQAPSVLPSTEVKQEAKPKKGGRNAGKTGQSIASVDQAGDLGSSADPIRGVGDSAAAGNSRAGSAAVGGAAEGTGRRSPAAGPVGIDHVADAALTQPNAQAPAAAAPAPKAPAAPPPSPAVNLSTPPSTAAAGAPDVITLTGGRPYKSEAAAKQGAKKNGVTETHDVVPAPSGDGFILRRKAPTQEATDGAQAAQAEQAQEEKPQAPDAGPDYFDVGHAATAAYEAPENAGVRKAWNDANLTRDESGGVSRANHDHFDEWHSRSKVTADVGSQYDAHGIAKGNPLGALLNLLQNGVNPTRRFDTAPLLSGSDGSGAGIGTASGGAYKDGPFIVLGERGKTIADGGIKTVLVSDAVANVIPALQERFPNIQFVTYGQAHAALGHATAQNSSVTDSPAAASAPDANVRGGAAPAASAAPTVKDSLTTAPTAAALKESPPESSKPAEDAKPAFKGQGETAAPAAAIDAAAHEAATSPKNDKPQPTPAQKEAIAELIDEKSGKRPEKEAPATSGQDEPFDSEAWDKARDDRIEASKKVGNKHLDQVSPSVETMRGREIFYAHNPKQRGVIRTVDNRGNVYVQWSDEYSAGKEMASEIVEDNKGWLKSAKNLPILRVVRDGKTYVMESSLGTSDLKDYVFADGAKATGESKPDQETDPKEAEKAANREKLEAARAKRAAEKATPEAKPAEVKPTADADLDAELVDALGHLGDVLGEVFGGQMNITGPQYGAGDLLPALSKVVELLVRKGFRSFQQAIGQAAKAIRGNPRTEAFVDRISARQWKAAYNAVAELHEGTDGEDVVGALSATDVEAIVGKATAQPEAVGEAAEEAPAQAQAEDKASVPAKIQKAARLAAAAGMKINDKPITAADVRQKFDAVVQEKGVEEARKALDTTLENVTERAKEELYPKAATLFREQFGGKEYPKEPAVLAAVKNGSFDISGQEWAPAFYEAYNIDSAKIAAKEAPAGVSDGVAAQLAKFNAGVFDLPKENAATLKKKDRVAEQKQASADYVEAARLFLEGPLDAKIPKGDKVEPLNLEFLENVRPQPITKKVTKAKGFEGIRKALHMIAAHQDIRYYLQGIHVEAAEKRLVATDGHRVAVLENADLSELPPVEDGKTVLNRYFGEKKGNAGAKPHMRWLDDRFPDWRRVMPDGHKRQDDAETFSAQRVGDYMRGVGKAYSYATKGKFGVGAITLGGHTEGVNAAYLAEAADLFLAFGYDKFTASQPGGPKQLIYMESPDGKLRQGVMPMRLDGWNPIFMPVVADNKVAQQAAEVKAAPKSELERPEPDEFERRQIDLENRGVDRVHASKAVREAREGDDSLLRDLERINGIEREGGAATGDADAASGSAIVSPMFAQRAAWGDFPDVVIAAAESPVKKHSLYHAAKTGDAEAAFGLVRDVLPDAVVDQLRAQFGKDAPTLVSAHALEADGVNAIPEAFADVLAKRLGWSVDNAVVQANVVNHTGADGFSRMGRQAVFAGDVPSGDVVLMVDDFVGQGGTLANLRGYLEQHGARVVGAIALTGKPYSAKLAVDDSQLAALREKHGELEDWWRKHFGFGFDRLTASEARYLERSKDADTIRDRIIAAEQAGSPADSHGADGSVSGSPRPSAGDSLDAAEAKAEKTAEKIEDFGEKIEGARKDLPPSLAHEFSDDEIAGKPLSEIWPASEIDKIEDAYAAAVSHAARAEIPAKPRVSWKLKRWVEQVKMLRGLARVIMDGNKDRFRSLLAQNRAVAMAHFRTKVELLSQLDRAHWKRVGAVESYPDSYTYDADGKQRRAPMSALEVDGKRHRLDGVTTVDELLPHAKTLLGDSAPGQTKEMQFEVRGRDGGPYSINKKGDPEKRELRSFNTTKEAFDFIRQNRADLVAAWEATKDRDNVGEKDVRDQANRKRSAKDWRGGKDVTPEQFSEAFGFRGVQFGNWVAQGGGGKARQGMLNEAFDALMDLADIVGVPPKALSLNGTLGLAFGARGSGWASAHYEPSNIVINLTKTRGAGTLAHEWLHALDNYFSHQRGGEVKIQRGLNAQQAYREKNYITYHPEPAFVHKDHPGRMMTKAELERNRKASPGNKYFADENWIPDPNHPEGVRPEVERAFAELVDALNDSPMAKRSMKIDRSENGYWSRIIERAARSFENYVIHKMMLNGYHNDYLANVTSVERFSRDPSRYPYLLEGEVKPVAEAFDNLFSTVQTKETDKGVAMFRLSSSLGEGVNLKPLAIADAAGVVGRIRPVAEKVWNVELRLVPTFSALPQDVKDEVAKQYGKDERPKGIIHRGVVFLVADEHSSPADLEATILHEVKGHVGIRRLYGADITRETNAIYARLGGHKGIAEIARKRDIDGLAEVAAQLEGSAFTDDIRTQVMIEEVIARMAEVQPSLLDRAKALIGKIRAWLRDKGFKAVASMGETDLLHITREAGKALETKAFAGDAASAPAALRNGAVSDLGVQLSEKVADYFTTSKTFNVWHKTVGTQFHKAWVDSDFAPVFRLGQRFLHDVSRFAMDAADKAPDLLPKIGSIKDVFKRGPKKADVAAVAKTIFDGTLRDEAYRDADLQAKGLTPEQRKLYRQAREAINQSLDDLFVAELTRSARNYLPLLGRSIVGMSAEDAHATVVEQVQAQAEDHEATAAMFPEDSPQRAKAEAQAATLRTFIKESTEKFNKIAGLKANGYAPLMRFGKYTLDVMETPATGGEPERVFFSMYETEAERNAAARQWRAMGDDFAVEVGQMSQEEWKLMQGVSPESLSIFAESLGADESEVFQEYLRRTLAGQSGLKRLIHRKKVPGFSNDLTRVLSTFITSNARLSARSINALPMAEAVKAIPKAKGDVKDEAEKLRQYLTNPKEEAAALRGYLFVHFIGGSIASALVNTTQPLTMTLPFLAQWGSAKAGKAMATAAKLVFRKNTGDIRLDNALHKAEAEGITAPHEIHQLYAESIRSLGSNIVARKALTVWGSAFALAEAFNRRLTFIAAFKMAQADPSLGHPFRFAERAVEETQGIYNPGNRPDWARGAMGATIFTFKQFSVSYLEFLKRLPPKQRALALAILVIAAGAQGLPFAEDIEDLIDSIGQSFGYNTNSKRWLHEFAVRQLGEGMGDFVTHGFSAIPGMPLDVQARMGLGNLIPGTGVFKRSEADKSRDVLEFIGPIGGLAQSGIDAVRNLQAGKPWDAFVSALPVAGKNVAKALEMSATGEYRDRTGKKVTMVDGLDASVKAIGFQPAHVADESRKAFGIRQEVEMARTAEKDIADKWARGIIDNEPELAREARQELLDWNRKNPETPIRITPQQIIQRVRQARMSRADRMVKSTPRELRGLVQREVSGG